MNHEIADALADVAADHDLGPLRSTHRNERPLVRRRARQWVMVLGPGVGGAVGLCVGVAAPEGDPTFALFIGLGVAFVVIAAGIGPLAASMSPPADGFRWLAVYEHGVVEIGELPDDRDDLDVAKLAEAMRFDEVVGLVQRMEHVAKPAFGLMGTALIVSASYELHAHSRRGNRVVELSGYRDEAKILRAIEAAVVPRLLDQARARYADSRAGVAFGPLSVSKDGLRAVRQTADAETSDNIDTLDWEQVHHVARGGIGGVLVRRHARPDDRYFDKNRSVVWFADFVPDGPVALALIQEICGRRGS